MPLPLLLIGAIGTAILGGGGAVVKGMMDRNKAGDVRNSARRRFAEARTKMEAERNRCNTALEELGSAKIHATSNLLKRVVAIADRVHRGENKDERGLCRTRRCLACDGARMAGQHRVHGENFGWLGDRLNRRRIVRCRRCRRRRSRWGGVHRHRDIDASVLILKFAA